jgi:hypothetical protein
MINQLMIEWSTPPANKEEAAERAVRLFEWSSAAASRAQGWQMLAQQLRKSLQQAGFQDLLQDRIQYVSRMTEPSGELLYEEMHKLLSLREQIEALLALLPEEREQHELADLDDGVRAALDANRRTARLVAEDRDDEFWRNFWWYEESRRG